MITVEYCQTMARYNAWQNTGVIAAMKTLSDKDLRKDRKLFFGSIFATANHLLWGDRLWMSRFDGGPGVDANDIKTSVNLHDSFDRYLGDRLSTDARIKRWADKLQQLDLIGPLTWFSGSINAELSKPKAMCVVHFFNHQTHHRGQLHAVFTATGYKIHVTDIPFMPEDA